MRLSSFVARIVEAAILAAIVFVAFCPSAKSQQASRSYALPHGDYEVEHFAVSASGDSILFMSTPNKDDGSKSVYFLNGKSGVVKKLLTGPNAAVFSAPGSHPFVILADPNLYFVQDDGTISAPI